MILIIIITSIIVILATAAPIILHIKDSYGYDGIITLFIVIAILFFIIDCIAIPFYMAASNRAAYYNNKYGTNYSADDMAFSSDLILGTQLEIKDKKYHLELE